MIQIHIVLNAKNLLLIEIDTLLRNPKKKKILQAFVLVVKKFQEYGHNLQKL